MRQLPGEEEDERHEEQKNSAIGISLSGTQRDLKRVTQGNNGVCFLALIETYVNPALTYLLLRSLFIPGLL